MHIKPLLFCCLGFALGACSGGDLDLGPNNPNFGASPPIEDTPDPVEKTYTWDFTDPADVAAWTTDLSEDTPTQEDTNRCNLDSELSLHYQTPSLVVSPTLGWLNDFDDMCALGMLPEPVDINGGKVEMSIYLPAYFTDSNPWNTDDDDNAEDDRFNFGLQVLIEDVDGNRAVAGGWRNAYELLGSSFNDQGIGYQQRTADPAAGEVLGRWFDLAFNGSSYSGADGDFDPAAVAYVGFMITLRDTNTDLPWPDNMQYVFVSNVAVSPAADGWVPPPVINPTQLPAEFALPVYVDEALSGFVTSWSGWGGTWAWAESIEAAFGAGGGGMQIGFGDAANIPDVTGYTNFQFSVYGDEGSGTSTLEISLCDCDDNFIAIETVEGEWTDISIPVADFTDTSLSAIRILYRGADAATFYIDNMGFDRVPDAPGGPLALTHSWVTEPTASELAVTYGAVSFSPAIDGDKVSYVFEGPADFSGATVTFTVATSQEFIDSGATVQPYGQEMFGNWDGEWNCAMSADQLTLGGTDHTCVFGDGFELAEGESIRVGVITKPQAEPEQDAAGTVTITRMDVMLATTPPTHLPVSMTKSWVPEGDDIEPIYSERVSVRPTSDNESLYVPVNGLVDLNGASIDFEFVVSQAYIDSGAYVQPFVQSMFGSWLGHWGCSANDLVVGINQYSCVIADTGFEVPAGERIKVGVIAKQTEENVNNPIEGLLSLLSVDIGLKTVHLPLASSWSTLGDDADLSYGGVRYTPEATDDLLYYEIPGPLDLTGGKVSFYVSADQDFVDSGARVQPFAQETGTWGGEWDCSISNTVALLTGVRYDCVVLGTLAAPEDAVMRIAVQPKDSEPSGVLSVHDVDVMLADDVAGPTIPLTGRWVGTDSDNDYFEQVALTPANADDAAFYLLEGPVDLRGAEVVFTIMVDEDFIASTANIQPYLQQTFGDWSGVWGCGVNNVDLVLGVAEYSCLVGTEDVYDMAEGEFARVGVLVKDPIASGDRVPADPAFIVDGMLIITDVKYTLQ